jgi:protein-S-isoprenylcysteine O-methyltransferase Ste14
MLYASIIGLWLILALFWLISAFNAKKTAVHSPWWKSYGLRLGIVILLVIFCSIYASHLRQMVGITHDASFATTPLLKRISVVLVALGVFIAIWARVYLGRNWGMPITLKENPDLVTTGPYQYIRNPIYTGMILAAFGSMTFGLFWVILFLVLLIYLTYASLAEEKIMAAQFPDTYPAYKAHTSRLIPFIF